MLEKIRINEEMSFRVQHGKDPYFYIPWHFHPEYELILILESTGTRFVGDHVGSFSAGDLVFLASNLPHVWQNDKKYLEENSNLSAHCMTIHFLDVFWEKEFTRLPEMQKLRAFFKKSRQGIAFHGKTREKLIKKMHQIDKAKGGKRLIEFIALLDIMANAEEIELLSSLGFIESYSQEDGERMNDIYKYIMNNFTSKIDLDEVAAAAHMSPTGFCRYFKKRTNKTFTKFLNEIRIGYACKLLIQGEYNIIRICYEAGFNNLSNFNEQFKKITGYTPSKYVKERAS